jgi:hypothetical protein
MPPIVRPDFFRLLCPLSDVVSFELHFQEPEDAEEQEGKKKQYRYPRNERREESEAVWP